MCTYSLILESNLLDSQAINQHMPKYIKKVKLKINMEPTCRAMATSFCARCSRVPFLPLRKIVGAQNI